MHGGCLFVFFVDIEAKVFAGINKGTGINVTWAKGIDPYIELTQIGGPTAG